MLKKCRNILEKNISKYFAKLLPGRESGCIFSLSIKSLKIKVMNQALSAAAFDLFLKTRSLENMSPEDPSFYDLYQKECELFDLLRQMNDEEKEDYRRLVWRENELEKFYSEELQWEYMNGEYPEDF